MLNQYVDELRRLLKKKMSDFLKPRKGISGSSGYLSPQIDVSVRLNANEAPDGPSKGFTAEHELNLNRYPDRSAEKLREEIAKKYGISANQVFAANGSNEVLQNFLLTYGGSERSLMVFKPTYVMHSKIAAITGTPVIEGERELDFSLNVESTCEKIIEYKPSLIFLCSPNNPTGLPEPKELPERILEILETYKGILLIDEAYGEFADTSFLSLLSEDHPLVISRTFSKAMGLAGLRLGYLLGPSWCIDEVGKVSLPYHLGTITQELGLEALKDSVSLEKRVTDIIKERDRISESLRKFSLEVWPSETNFILFKAKNQDARQIWEELISRSILIRDFSMVDGLEGCLRVTVGKRSENDLFIEALGEILK